MFSLFWPRDLRVRDLGRLDPSTLCTPQCSVRACTGVVMHFGTEYEGGTDKGFCRYRPRSTHKKGLGRVTHTKRICAIPCEPQAAFVQSEDDGWQDEERTGSLPPSGVEGTRELSGLSRLQELQRDAQGLGGDLHLVQLACHSTGVRVGGVRVEEDSHTSARRDDFREHLQQFPA